LHRGINILVLIYTDVTDSMVRGYAYAEIEYVKICVDRVDRVPAAGSETAYVC